MPHQCCLWQLVVFCSGLWPRFVFVVFFCVGWYANLAGGFAFRPSAFAFWLLVFAMCCCPSKHICTAVTWETWSDVLPILFVLPAFNRASELYRPYSEEKKVQICICKNTWSDDTTSSSMCTVVTFGQCNPQQKGVWMDIYIYPTECRVLHLLPLRYPERHFRRLPALETRCFESDSLTCFGRFGHFRPYKWFAGVVGRLEAILQHWTTGMTFLVILDIGCCFGLAWSTLRLWPVLAVLDMIGLFWPASVSQAILRCFRDQQCGCDAFTWNFWDFESIDNAKRWNACVMGVFLHPGSKAETAWFERNFIFFDEIDDKQCHRTVRRKNRFAAHVFMSVFRPRETNFFTQTI